MQSCNQRLQIYQQVRPAAFGWLQRFNETSHTILTPGTMNDCTKWYGNWSSNYWVFFSLDQSCGLTKWQLKTYEVENLTCFLFLLLKTVPSLYMEDQIYTLLYILKQSNTHTHTHVFWCSFSKNAFLISYKLALHRQNVFSNLCCEDAQPSGEFLPVNGAKYSRAT